VTIGFWFVTFAHLSDLHRIDR